MDLIDQLEPTKSLLIIKEDQRSDVLFSLDDGKKFVRPEISGDKQRTRSGVVLKAGPKAVYRPGTRVLFGAFAATKVAAGGGELLFLPSDEVNGYLGGEEEADSEPGPAWLPHLFPPPGEILVRRSEKPLLYGRIHLPPNASSLATRCMEAEVLAVSPGSGFEVDEHVLLSPYVSKTIQLDVRGEHLVSRLEPSQVLARINGVPDRPVEMGQDYTGVAEDLAAQEDVDERFNEGDPLGPR